MLVSASAAQTARCLETFPLWCQKRCVVTAYTEETESGSISFLLNDLIKTGARTTKIEKVRLLSTMIVSLGWGWRYMLVSQHLRGRIRKTVRNKRNTEGTGEMLRD